MVIHFRFAPTPATLVHWICVFAMLTLHPLAVYVVPVAPYVAVTTVPLVGPKFEPVNVIVVPTPVDMLPPPATLLIVGGEYDTVPDDNTLA